MRAASTTPSPAALNSRSNTANPSTNGNAQVASPDAVVPTHNRTNPASRRTDRAFPPLDVPTATATPTPAIATIWQEQYCRAKAVSRAVCARSHSR
ncbi:hypothetical protein GCM10010171_33020 [Actinokineospora fastidiosa]|uniref:Uncharacterized protein n=1 Tax=Actinokineospora fastidiosa TaxID=1816 RepID=A0A918LEL3_9PSEU|nr:hypothetical protein GCM10010171_33020 [Actinokineospora fastidiosa]